MTETVIPDKSEWSGAAKVIWALQAKLGTAEATIAELRAALQEIRLSSFDGSDWAEIIDKRLGKQKLDGIYPEENPWKETWHVAAAKIAELEQQAATHAEQVKALEARISGMQGVLSCGHHVAYGYSSTGGVIVRCAYCELTAERDALLKEVGRNGN